MEIYQKKKTSKLSCDLLRVGPEVDGRFEVVAYNFYRRAFGEKTRWMRKEQLLKNYNLCTE